MFYFTDQGNELPNFEAQQNGKDMNTTQLYSCSCEQWSGLSSTIGYCPFCGESLKISDPLIKANKTILWNKLSNVVFLADKTTELTQCKGQNREHIVPVGCELDIPVPDIYEVLMQLFEEIKHGDEEHQKWLLDKINDFSIKKGFNHET